MTAQQPEVITGTPKTTAAIVAGAIVLIATTIAGKCGYIIPQTVLDVWQVVGPIVLGLLGFQNSITCQQVKEVKARMLK